MKWSISVAIWAGLAASAGAATGEAQVGRSPWGADDEIGRLNLMTEASRAEIMSRADGAKVYDLSVDYFVGMPSWHGIGDPRYQFWLTHTPRGTAVDDPMRVGKDANRHVSYTGDAISMYTHMGTHIDALNHFGLHGRIFNGFSADEHLGDLGWRKAGAPRGRWPSGEGRGRLRPDVEGRFDAEGICERPPLVDPSNRGGLANLAGATARVRPAGTRGSASNREQPRARPHILLRRLNERGLAVPRESSL